MARAMLGVSGADVLHPEYTPHTYTAYSSCVYTAVEVVASGCVHSLWQQGTRRRNRPQIERAVLTTFGKTLVEGRYLEVWKRDRRWMANVDGIRLNAPSDSLASTIRASPDCRRGARRQRRPCWPRDEDYITGGHESRNARDRAAELEPETQKFDQHD